jgi:hypothetical protein
MSKLWLEWNSTTTQETPNREICGMTKLWLEWDSTTTQETQKRETCRMTKLWLERRYHNHTTTKRTMKHKRRQNRRIFGLSRKRGEFTATLWLERRFNNDTGVRNWRKKTVLKCFFERGATMMC